MVGLWKFDNSVRYNHKSIRDHRDIYIAGLGESRAVDMEKCGRLIVAAVNRFKLLAEFMEKDELEIAETADLVQMVKDRRSLLKKKAG
jgi:hypothetical protein